jgi:hypothetical protein
MTNGNNYATDTDGLPKTDFKIMQEAGYTILARVGFHINPTIDNDSVERMLNVNGMEAGTAFFEECAAFESIVKSADYNVFADSVYKPLHRMLMSLIIVYQARLSIRNELSVLRNNDTFEDLETKMQRGILTYNTRAYQELIDSCVDISKRKDKEYGASWCKRGGIGAWFTTVRKFDRLHTQLKMMDFNIWDVSLDVQSTESLEETLLDAINYLLLINEKSLTIAKEAIRVTR